MDFMYSGKPPTVNQLRNLREGERMIYHIGWLAIDRHRIDGLQTLQDHLLGANGYKRDGEGMWKLVDEKKQMNPTFVLTQMKVGRNFAYVAQKARVY